MAVIITDREGKVLDSPFAAGYIPARLSETNMIVVDDPRNKQKAPAVIADRDLYVNGEGQLVDRKAPDRRIMLARKGQVVPEFYMADFGLRVEDNEVVQGAAPVLEEIEEMEDEAPKAKSAAAKGGSKSKVKSEDEDDTLSL